MLFFVPLNCLILTDIQAGFAAHAFLFLICHLNLPVSYTHLSGSGLIREMKFSCFGLSSISATL